MVSLLLIVAMTLAACGGSEPEPTATPQPMPTTPPTTQPTAQPTAAPPTAQATMTAEPQGETATAQATGEAATTPGLSGETTTQTPAAVETAGISPTGTVTDTLSTPATGQTPQAVATPQPILTGTGQATRSQTMMKAHTLLGYGVRSGDGEGIGDVRELLIDADSGQVTYVLLGVGGFLGLGETLIAVPWQAFELAADEPVFVVPSLLAADVQNVPVFDNAAWTDPAAPGWDADIATFWQGRVTGDPGFTGAMAGDAIKANVLLEYGIRNTQNEDLGRVADLLIGMDSGHVLYLIMARGGILGIGEDLWAIPWQATNVDATNQVVLFGIDASAFEAAPRFDSSTWPDRAAAGWDESIMGYWESLWDRIDTADADFVPGALATPALTTTVRPTPATPITTTGPMTATSGTLLRASEMIGYGVRAPDGGGIGDVRELLVDLDNQQVTYAILGVGGFLGLGETLIAVPWQAFDLVADEPSVLAHNVTRTDIENAPVFDNAAWTDPADPGWDADLATYWASWLTDTAALEPGRTAKINILLNSPIREAALAISPLENGVADFAIDADSGKVVYAIILRSGDLTQQTVLVPWDAVTVDVETQSYTVTLDPEQYRDAPLFDDFGWSGPLGADILPVIQNYWATMAPMTPITGTNTSPLPDTTPQATTAAQTPAANATAIATPQATITDTVPMTGTMPTLMRARHLMDYGVSNPVGDDLGRIVDLLVDVDNGRVAYAIVSVGGFLGIGDQYMALPLRALSYAAEDRRLLSDITIDDVGRAPVFDNDTWTDPADPGWDDELRAFWDERFPLTDETGAGMPITETGRLVKMTTLMQYVQQVQTTEGGTATDEADTDEGTIIAPVVGGGPLDIVFNLADGQIMYAVVSQLPQFIGRLLPVPLDRVIMNSEQGTFDLDVTYMDILNAPRWDDFYSPGMTNSIRQYWDTHPDMSITPTLTTTVTTPAADATVTPIPQTNAAGTPVATTTTTAEQTPATNGTGTPAATTAAQQTPAADATAIATPAATLTVEPSAEMTETEPSLIMGASTLIGYGVRTADGEGIGDVRELLVDQDRQQVTYAILGVGGFLGLGETLIAVPWHALDLVIDEPAFALDVTRADIENAPVFDNSAWTDPAAPGWDADLATYWANWLTDAEMPAEGGRTFKVTPLLDYTIGNPPVGAAPFADRLYDLAIDMETGKVLYAVMSPLADTVINDLAVAVPMEALQWDAAEQVFTLNVSPQALRQAPLIRYGEWTGPLDNELSDLLGRHWNNALQRATDSGDAADDEQ